MGRAEAEDSHPDGMEQAAARIRSLEDEAARLRRELETLRARTASPDLMPFMDALLAFTPDHVYFKDLQGRFICASRALAEYFHLADASELIGKSDFDFFSAPHAQRAHEDEQEIIRTGQPKVGLEEAETWPDGRITWVSTTKLPFRDASGTICGTFGISRDITARKSAEEALRLGEERFRMIFDHGVDAVLLGSPEGNVIGMNAAASSLSGWPMEELMGMHIMRFFTPETLAQTPLRFDLLKQGQTVVSDRWLVRKDGTQIPIEMHSKMMPDGTYQAIFRDLTERMRHEAELRESEESYRGLFDSVADGIYIQDREGRFLDVNRGVLTMYGRPKEFFLGKTPEVLAAPGLNDLDGLGRVLERAFRGEPQRFEFWGVRANGEVFPMELRAFRGAYFGRDVIIALTQDISERKNAEKALQESEQHHRDLLDRLQEGFAFADTDERFVFANAAAARIFGVTGSLVGHNLREFITPETLEEVNRRTEDRRLGRAGHYELHIQRPDGAARVLSLSVSPWVGEDGAYLGSTGLFQDITEQKQAMAALRKSERNFRTLIDKLGEGFGIVDPDERWTFANQAAERIFGAEPGELVGRSFRDFVDETMYAQVLQQTAQRRSGVTSTYEITIHRLDGAQRIVALTASPYLDESGTFLGADGLFVDITERKAAEAALRESEQRYLDLFNNTTDAIFWIQVGENDRFVVESINPAEEARMGLPNGAIAGKGLDELLPPVLGEAVKANYRRCLAAGAPLRYEEQAELQGRNRVFQTLLVPIRNAQGVIARLVGFSQDITQSKQAEDALRQAQKLESLGVLAGGIAHDFNNLLTAMLGNLNLAQIHTTPESPGMPYLENVERTVLKAAELTKQMLAYSGKGRFVVKPHDLNQVVQEMTHLLGVSISKKVRVHYELARELPFIEADAAQIQQVIMNLVTNASEAIGETEGVIRVVTREEELDAEGLATAFAGQELQPGRYVVLEIADTGMGIAPDIRSRIFDPFFSTKQSGRGLGLSAMQGILRGHRAGIQIQSTLGKGATFSVYFPAASRASLVAAMPAPVLPRSRMEGRVLLVDDEAEVRAATAAMLQSMGFEVVQAVDGGHALERFTIDGPSIDFVLLDLTMPRMDGRETFAELRRIRADLPVILYSGYSEHEQLSDVLSQPSTCFLQKPFQLDDLQHAIRQVRTKA